jgi:hypothetical protein
MSELAADLCAVHGGDRFHRLVLEYYRFKKTMMIKLAVLAAASRAK